MGISGAERATIFNPVDNDYVLLRLISQDSDYEKIGRGEEDLDGNELWVEDHARLELVFYDDADVAKLKSWQENHTPLNVTVIGVQDYIFWDQPSTILLVEPHNFKTRRRNVRKLTTKAKGTNLAIERTTPVELFGSDGVELMGFIAKNETDDGVEAHSLFPATFGIEGTTTWTIGPVNYVMDTVTFNTLN